MSPLLMAKPSLESDSIPKNYQEIIQLLIAKGADINQSGTDKRTPAMLLARLGQLALINALTEKGVDFSARDADGRGIEFYISACTERCSKEERDALNQLVQSHYQGQDYVDKYKLSSNFPNLAQQNLKVSSDRAGRYPFY